MLFEFKLKIIKKARIINEQIRQRDNMKCHVISWYLLLRVEPCHQTDVTEIYDELER